MFSFALREVPIYVVIVGICAACVAPAGLSGPVIGIFFALALVAVAALYVRGDMRIGVIEMTPLIALVALLISAVMSALVAHQLTVHAFSGRVLEWGTVASLVLLALPYVLGSLLDPRTRVYTLVLFESASLILAGAVALDLLGISHAYAGFWSWNEATLLLAAASVVGALQADARHATGRIFHICVAAAGLFGVVILYTPGAAIAGALALLYGAYSLFAADRETIPFVSLGVALLMIVSALFSSAPRMEVPVEVRPSFTTTAWIVGAQYRSTLPQALIGSAPNGFEYAWERYRPIDMNETPLWSYTPSEAYSSAMQILIEYGLLGTFAFALFFFIPIYRGVLRHDETAVLALAVFCAAASLIASVPLPLFVIAVLLLGSLSAQAVARAFLVSRPHRYVIAGLALICAIGMGFVCAAQLHAAYLDARGTAASQQRDAAVYFGSAANAWPATLYFEHAARAYSSLVAADATIAKQSPALTTIVPDYAMTTSYANALVGLVPKDFSAWLLRATIFSDLTSLKIAPLAADASQSFAQAKILSPTRPDTFFFEARLAAQLGDIVTARALLTKALLLKPDYEDAQTLLEAVGAGQ